NPCAILGTFILEVGSSGPYKKVRVCAQAPDSGLCFGYFERYFYNFRKGRCEIFIYGGCLGNQNNFLTEKECLCILTKLPQPHIPPDSGLCFGYFERYFYNFRKGRCEIFIYGGCLGNQNNFLTEKECLQRYVCTLDPDPGPCECYSERYFYNFKKRRCEIFIYGCCNGNQNNFETEQECLRRCRFHYYEWSPESSSFPDPSLSIPPVMPRASRLYSPVTPRAAETILPRRGFLSDATASPTTC
uniref:BPTI/Kunitz inhibitor domain-containing protein n=1 Tax=Oryzias latipes TaxID=8090 RepID=A0A3B3IBU7_ORYLA